MAFQEISKNYLDVLAVKKLLHFLEFHCYYLLRVEQLCPPIFSLNLKDLKALVDAILALKLFALSVE